MVPDTQVRPGVPIDHFTWIGNYIDEKRPDVIVHLGDHYDMASLSRHSEGKHELDQTDVDADIEAGNTALLALHKAMSGAKYRGIKRYAPRKVLLRGNHEDRIRRFLEQTSHARFKTVVSEKRFNDKALGWQPVEFLKPIDIGGIWFCHYFYNQLSGRPYGGTASNKLRNVGFSFVMGHVQGLDMATRSLANGATQWGIVAGSCYRHTESYKGPQANDHWRGVIMLHEVDGGNCNPMVVSLDYLQKRYS